ncbi:GMC oxidoreductase [Zasmidium cellare ATCC 36951]|uniref:GMC oxidoreductase n=1 Tax=Zasmidium cellare ATCC 36951 TaxID=1080233 RepID=A0A6A6CGU3_ZASCE|nr:GMC oxidoreductase [Zasmidium cellare ATCC 36951]KAF2165162.1 GMC oxidoreductase [Zasmidium cellare ATCC 36951]
MAFALLLRLACACVFYVTVCDAKLCRGAHDLKAEYDYVVVGGGTSGLVVANRLTENPHGKSSSKVLNVLVIELGDVDDGSPGTLVPGIQTPQKYWHTYTSVPQKGLNNRTSQLYTGEVVGGGTVINGMFFNRGSALDYDAWEELGNPGWGWEDLLPYFKKSETYSPATPQIQAQYPASPDLRPHGTRGPVGSSYPPFSFDQIRNWFSGWASLGVLVNPQPNAGMAVGAIHSSLSLAQPNVSRSSAADAYFRGEASQRENFDSLTAHRVVQILFEGKTASGVEYAPRNGSQTSHVKVSREVIVAAGAARSPQLLQLSGIGPRELLTGLDIPLVKELPGVGYNFQDQPSYYIALNLTKLSGPIPAWVDPTSDVYHEKYAEQQLALYYADREGAYTMPYQAGSDVAFLPLKNVTSDYAKVIDHAKTIDIDDISPSGTDPSIIRGHKAQVNILLRHYASRDTAVHESTFNGSPLMIIVALKPLSRGSILINSTDPKTDPQVDFGTFTHPTDVDVLVASLKKIRELLNSPAMQELGAIELSPGHSVQSDAEIAAALINSTLSSWQHPVGTLAMMPEDLGGVLDPELRVYGIEGLRVVDASMMPIIPASHTSSTVYAVAEKAADLIKASQSESGQYR